MKQLTSTLMLIVCGFVTINIHTESISDPIIKQQTDRPERVWITLGSDASKQILKHHSNLDLRLHNNAFKLNADAQIASIPADKIEALSHYMHQAHNRCGGFFFHESLQKAQQYSLYAATIQPLAVSYTVDNPEGVNTLLNTLSSSNLSATVSSLANFNNRYYTQQSGVDAAHWIRDQWQTISQGRSDISVALYGHSWNQPSVIATITGTTHPNEIVVIGGHLDSINSSGGSTARAPGADDNASGIAVVTETLRAMVASGYKPARTIKLMGYAAEEVGLRGSKAIAQNFRANNQNVVGVVQFDMTGVKGTANRDIVFMTDYTNSAQNNFMMQLLDTYLPSVAYGTSACGYGCSDHASWHNEGYPASMPFESNMNDSNRKIHTANDTSFSESHSINFARLSVTYLAEMAKGGTGTPPPPPPPPAEKILQNGVPVSGLAVTKGNDVVYTMDVPSGASNIRFNISGGSGDADLYVRFAAAPTDSQYDCRPYKNGNNETCTGSQTGGTYYVRLKAYSSFSGVSLVGSYSEGGPGNPPIDDTVNNINLSRGEWIYRSVDLNSGYSSLVVTISGGSGDADLYVRRGSQPTTSSYDCRPYKNGNNETCTLNAPAAGTWHIGVRGYSSSSGVTLNIKGNP